MPLNPDEFGKKLEGLKDEDEFEEQPFYEFWIDLFGDFNYEILNNKTEKIKPDYKDLIRNHPYIAGLIKEVKQYMYNVDVIIFYDPDYHTIRISVDGNVHDEESINALDHLATQAFINSQKIKIGNTPVGINLIEFFKR